MGLSVMFLGMKKLCSYICDLIRAMRFCKLVWGIISSGIKMRGEAWGDCLFCHFKRVVLHFVGVERVFQCGYLPFQCQNPSYVADHYSFYEKSFSKFLLTCWWRGINVGIMQTSFKFIPKILNHLCKSFKEAQTGGHPLFLT